MFLEWTDGKLLVEIKWGNSRFRYYKLYAARLNFRFFLNVNFNGMCQKTDLDIHRQCLSVCMIKELIVILVPNPFFFFGQIYFDNAANESFFQSFFKKQLNCVSRLSFNCFTRLKWYIFSRVINRYVMKSAIRFAR